MASTQNRITEAGPLLTADGTLAQAGWATQQLLRYDRKQVRASALRIKEWDYYLVNDDQYALAFTISDLSYAALVSVALIDFTRGTANTQSTLGVLPLGRVGLPTTSASGVSTFADNRARLYFAADNGMRHLVVDYYDFGDGLPFHAEIVLDEQPRDTMVIATPWAEDPLAFYYNQKIVGMRAVGSFAYGAINHDFTEANSFGLLDWGRGVWTRDNTWFWSAAQGRQAGHVFAFNLGYGFGDTSAASENMVFVDGIAHKLGRVSFGIPVRDAGAAALGERYALMQPWHFTDDEGRLDLSFTPTIDRDDLIDLKLVRTDQHQVFGTFAGSVILDDGTPFAVKDLRGFVEVVHNVY